MTDTKLRTLIEEAENLPVLPHIAMEILERIEDPMSMLEDFKNLIEKDQVLTMRILRLANSAYYGYPREISKISDAIIILGLDTIRSLVLAISTRQMMISNVVTYGLKKGELWEHSVCVALMARLIARELKIEDVEKYFVAGLVHDIGKLVIDSYVRKEREKFISQIKTGGVSITEAEERVIGYNHSFIGAEIAKTWKLPDFIVSTIKYHHDPYNAGTEFYKDATIIALANELSYELAKGVGDILLSPSMMEQKKKEIMFYARQIGFPTSKIQESLKKVGDALATFRGM